jgi:hypothetical protein
VRKAFSDPSDHGIKFNETPYTKLIQKSVRINFRKLLLGDGFGGLVAEWGKG